MSRAGPDIHSPAAGGPRQTAALSRQDRASTLLLERDGELDVLRTRLASSRQGEGSLVLIRGAVGLGKSVLLSALAQIAGHQRVSILWARGAEVEQQLPFGIAIQLFERRVHEFGSDTKLAPFGGAASPSRALFESGHVSPGSTRSAELAMAHALHWLAANLATRDGLVLLVDDAHWADRQSLRFLQYLAHRVRELPVLLAVAYRQREPRGDTTILDDLAAGPGTDVLEPQLLSEDAVRRLVEQTFETALPAFVRRCYEVTGGWPLHVRDLLGSAAREGIPADSDGAVRLSDVAPKRASDAIRQQLSRISQEAVNLAISISVLGPDSDIRRAAELAVLPAAEAASLADEMAGVEILSPSRLEFARPAAGTAIYNALSVHRREEMHLRAAGMLHRDGSPVGRIAFHLQRARPAGLSWAVDCLLAAAHEASAGGEPAIAAMLLQRALAEPAPRERRPEITRAIALALSAGGNAAASEAFATALSLATNIEQRAELVEAQARFLAATGHAAEAARALDQMLSELPSGPTDLRCTLQTTWISISRTDSSMRPEVLDRLSELPSAIPENPTLAQRRVLAHIARERVFAGWPRTEAVDLARKAYGHGKLLAEETSDGPTWSAALSALAWADHLSEYHQGIEDGLADARQRGSLMAFATCSHGLMFSNYYSGRVAAAVADAEQALSAEALGWAEYVPACRSQLAWALLELGQPDAARAAIAPLFDDERWKAFPGWALVLHARGRIRLAAGDAHEALTDFKAAGRVINGAFVPNPAVVPWASAAAEAAARLGRFEEAQAFADQELEAARRFGAQRCTGIALRARGLAEPAESTELLRQAVEALRDSPAQLELVRALVDLGASLRHGGYSTDAREPLREALDLSDRAGMLALKECARAELVAAGGRPRRSAISGRDALTPSERRVAEMAASGMTNRQIAEDQFVTVKAVQWHLRNAYRKLGIGDRSQLSTILADWPQP